MPPQAEAVVPAAYFQPLSTSSSAPPFYAPRSATQASFGQPGHLTAPAGSPAHHGEGGFSGVQRTRKRVAEFFRGIPRSVARRQVASSEAKDASGSRRLREADYRCEICGDNFTKLHNLESEYFLAR
jgi:hypothetical protein